jgi:hypothetical protein
LATTASISIAAVGSTTPTLSIDVVATGISSPTGVGTLFSSASGTYTGVASGSTSFVGDYQTTTLTPPIVGSASGGITSYSSSNPGMAVGTVPSGYTLSNHFVVGLSQSVGGTEGFSGSVLLVTSSVPEPSSVVMLSMGMPLLLAIGFGLNRRRRALAAA